MQKNHVISEKRGLLCEDHRCVFVDFLSRIRRNLEGLKNLFGHWNAMLSWEIRLLKTRLATRLDFRRSLVSGLRPSAGSFPEQRLVIEPILPLDLPYRSSQQFWRWRLVARTSHQPRNASAFKRSQGLQTLLSVLLKKLPDPFLGSSTRSLPFSDIIILAHQHKVTRVGLPCDPSVVASQFQSLIL